MTLYEFNCLDKEFQFDTIFRFGIFLDVSITGNVRYALYAIDKFFVEVAYDSKKNSLSGCKSFMTGQLLDKYSKLKI